MDCVRYWVCDDSMLSFIDGKTTKRDLKPVDIDEQLIRIQGNEKHRMRRLMEMGGPGIGRQVN